MFSIITANWNGEKYLDRFLNSLQNQTFKEFKLYLIDNGSIDASLEKVTTYSDSLDIHVTKLDKNLGFSIANNIGIDEAMSDDNDFIITLNNDIELEPECLANLNKKISNLRSSYDVFQLLMLNYYDRNIIDAAGIELDPYYTASQIGFKEDKKNLDQINEEIQGACAGAAVYSKQALNTVKEKNGDYFDSRFFAYYEDVDLAMRLRNSGFKTYLIKDAIVFHIHSGTGVKGSAFKEYYLSRNELFYKKKNLSIQEFRKISSRYYLRMCKRIVKLTIQGEFKLIKACVKGYQDYLEMIK